MKKIIIILVLASLFSCSKDNLNPKLDIDVSDIEVEVIIKRFEKQFYTAKPSDLPRLKKEFGYFFPHNIDSIWVNKMSDKDEQELFRATQKSFPNLKQEKQELKNLFKHIKYYYPSFKEPKVVTLNANVDVDNKVVYADSLLFISLDVFLGKDSYIYQDYPVYLKNGFSKKQLVVNVAKELAKPIIFDSKDRTFLGRMIQQGKLMYVLDAYLPNYLDEEKMNYTSGQLKWIESNEQVIWQYFIEKEMLYDTDLKLNRRFIDEAPFSKFYLDIDNESPGGVGIWMGWQIVRSFMNSNDNVELTELMKMKNEVIFKKSKYKPRR